ncbi:PAS domain-containing protein [Massilia scottii]|uniref:PAS domain-containing protein n=1 Tax=Massilia scottii TaxID=3057166 RepID=UPI00279698D4|nr:PAS domain-containing protein [Massilia sp. CCM 9029]MDQ1830354.1 PAS domain-containing protein [Massilia sp. CCM 9029]
MSFSSRSTLPSIRSKTATLVLACALPTLIGFAALSYDSFQREHQNLLRDAERLAQNVLQAAERDLDAGETAARALASSPSLTSGDLADFHYQARSILGPEFPGYAFVLSDLDGKPLLNTRVAHGLPLPPNGNVETIRQVAVSGLAATSDLHRATPGAPYTVSVEVPVRRHGEVVYVLSAQLRPERFNQLLADQRLPPRWNAQLFDRSDIFVARSIAPEKFVGALARPEMADLAHRANSGTMELTSREGVRVISSLQRSPRRGWYATVALPRDAAYEAMREALASVFLSVAALLVVGFAAAWTIGGVIGRSVRSLCAPAAALGRGEPMALPPMQIREVADVAGALQHMDGELQRYRNDLETLVAERTGELERANALLETVYATAPVGLALLDADLRIVMVNEYLAAVNAMPVAAHLGRTLPELLGPLGAEFEKAYRQVRDTGLPIKSVHESRSVPGSPDVESHWVTSYHPVFGPDHALVGISAVVLDVSERKLLSDRLRDVNEQFRALYEMSGDAHMLVAQGAGFIGGNQAAVRIYGCATIEEFLTLSPATTSPEFQPDGRRSDEKAEQFIRYAIETGSHHFEWLHMRRDGTLFNADVLLTSVNVGGKGILQSTVRDISERVAAEKALRATSERLEQSERFIRTVTDNVPGMVAYWDAELRCQFANRRYLELFGRSATGMTGARMDDILGPETMADIAPHLREVLDGKATHFARDLHEPSGEVRHTWANYIPDFDEEGAVRGFYVLISDVSELKRTELRLQSLNEQLIQALERAESASRAKSQFLANMSHEIRTPMNAIMGLARLLEEGSLERRERSYVAKIKMSTRSLMGILSDVLDFSKIEAGQLVLESSPFPLCQVLDSISVLLSANAWNKGVELVYAVAPDVPLTVVGDALRLEQVLLNLIGNAIKFTEQGEVVLSITRRSEADGVLVLDFAVRDSGIGIAREQQAHMFDAFSQGDTSTSRKYGGTGLGLAICRRLVGLMGGTLGVRSELGAGAEFHFDSAFGAAHADDAAVLPVLPALPAGAVHAVLVVDDNRSARDAVARLCASFGWVVDSAASGAEALELLRAAGRAGVPYDLMFLDTAMAELDGIAVLTFARADPAIVMPRCALMVAESAREQLVALQEDLKLDAIMSKPVTRLSLITTAIELHTGKAAPDAAPELPLAGRLKGMYVLLVEDNQINQEVAKYILLHAGAAVDIADNGRIAVSMLADAPSRYDAVLMDIQMPVMNGYQAAEAIRRMGVKALPIIAMTANAMEEDRHHAIAAGMNGHVAKPIDVDNLVNTLIRVTSDGAVREAHAPASMGHAPKAALPGSVRALDIPGIDLASTLPRFGGNIDNFVTLFKRFESSQGQTLDEVRALLRGEERQEAIQLVHRLRGVAANLGASELAALAFDFEQALRGAGSAELTVRLGALDKALQAVFETARALPAPAAAGVLPGAQDPLQINAALPNLLSLLQNNNLKAMAAFDALRPVLDAALAPAVVSALGDAVATLGFANAALQVQEILKRRDHA